jgi:hypothetical protein
LTYLKINFQTDDTGGGPLVVTVSDGNGKGPNYGNAPISISAGTTPLPFLVAGCNIANDDMSAGGCQFTFTARYKNAGGKTISLPDPVILVKPGGGGPRWPKRKSP